MKINHLLFTTICLACFSMLSCTKKSNEVNIDEDDLETPGKLEIIGGKLPGEFSISENRKIQFSQGNLQYLASAGTWRFAEHQYDNIGEANSKISASCSTWIDLFGWGTGNNPTKIETDYKTYSTFSEWGQNPISNGGDKANVWRTLTEDEWEYVLNARNNATSLRGQAKVNDIPGYILLPNDFVLPKGVNFTADSKNAKDNAYTLNQWTKLEIAGAVFFPCCGQRYQTTVQYPSSCNYWSSTPHIVSGAVNGEAAAYYIHFTSQKVNYDLRTYGMAVRLVQDVQ